jgi:cell wall-associated NlpC family hydrolase
MMTYAKVNLFVENFEASGFEQVLAPEVGDALLIQSGLATFDGPDHVGIYVGDDKFLHHYRGRMSTVQPYSSMWRQKTTMVLRHTSRM